MPSFSINLQQGYSFKTAPTAYKRNNLLYNNTIKVLKKKQNVS